MGWCDGESLAFWHGAVPAGVGSVCTLGLSLRARLLGTLAAQAEREVDVLGLDRHATAVDARAVRVREQRHNVRLGCLLCSQDRAALEAQTLLLCSGHLAHEALEGRLLQQQVRGALELADLAERHRPGPPAALRVLHARAGVRCLGRLLALLRRHRLLRAAVSLVRDMVLCLA
ncbi:hypothetical protein ERJ75_000317200 [Trypanosoma vivax]|nr:hypothetical protein ERJ75_000317200 [Trypanosoma vivax]